MLTGFPASGSGVCGERIYFLSSGDARHKLFADEISNFLKTKFRMYDNTARTASSMYTGAVGKTNCQILNVINYCLLWRIEAGYHRQAFIILSKT
jgi:hypothetical protein